MDILDDVCRVGIFIAISHAHSVVVSPTSNRVIFMAQFGGFVWVTLHRGHSECLVWLTAVTVTSQNLSKHYLIATISTVTVGISV